ncbi:MAG: DinB family protein [Sphingobacteriaceae bacterium]
MSVASDKRAIEKLFLTYRDRLDTFSDDEYIAAPTYGWCYAEVYSHVLQVIRISFVSIEECIQGNAKKRDKPLHWLVWLILLSGRFPPRKYIAPPNVADLVKPISREEARNGLIKVRKKLDELFPKITKATSNHKIKHPKLGLLNARQWLRFMCIHTAHHLRQLDRVKKINAAQGNK